MKDSCCWQSSAGISCFRPDQASGSEMRWKRKRIPMPFGRTCANSRKLHHAVFLLTFAFTKEPMFMITSTAQLPRRATPLGKKVGSQWCQGDSRVERHLGFPSNFWKGPRAGDFCRPSAKLLLNAAAQHAMKEHASFLLSCSGANASIDSKKHPKTSKNIYCNFEFSCCNFS